MWLRSLSLWTSPQAVLRQVLALDDRPHAVALGAAVGMMFGMTPTVGLQTMEVILFALVTRRIFYFNRAAALALIYVSNPLTVAPIYYGLYRVGNYFVPVETTWRQFQWIPTFKEFAGWGQSLNELATGFGLPLAIGTAVVAPAAGAITYPLIRFLLQWYRGDKPPAEKKTTAQNHEGAQPNTETGLNSEISAYKKIMRPCPSAMAGLDTSPVRSAD